MDFEWDEHNREKNWYKHQVSSNEAEEVFKKGLFLGPIPCDKEDRFSVIGRTEKGRTLFVVYTLRDEKVRVISARNASRKERKSYEEKNKTTSQI